jgi:hypothetical protein
MGSWDSSVGIVAMLQTTHPRKCGSILSRHKRFSSSPKSFSSSGAHPAHCLVDNGQSFPGLKGAGM